MSKLACAIVCVLIIAPLTARAAPSLFSYYEDAMSSQALHAEAGILSTVGSDSYNVGATGTVTGTMPAGLRKVAGEHGIALLAVVSNYGTRGFSASIARAVLAPGEAQDRAITDMVGVAGHHLAGINLDFENVPHGLRAEYTAFVGRLAARMHAAGKVLVLSVPAATKDDPSDSWTGAFDYAAIGVYADTLQVMTYDENGPWSTPGPVAGLDWVKACLTYTQSVAPLGKISLGMPAYGYDWDLTAKTGRQVAWKVLPTRIASTGATPQWDSATSSPWVSYTAADGHAHVVWYENERSIGAKASLANSHGVASVSVWDLGMDDPAFWRAVQTGFQSDAH